MIFSFEEHMKTKATMFLKDKQKQGLGFTLIELLVVIAIIGLLSVIAVISLNSARAKARDARRVSDVKQLSKLLEMQATVGAGTEPLTGCTGSDVLTTTCNGPGQISQFNAFSDPSNPSEACFPRPVANTNPCGYGISRSTGQISPTVANYEICFYLESEAGDLTSGMHRITNGSQIFRNCQ